MYLSIYCIFDFGQSLNQLHYHSPLNLDLELSDDDLYFIGPDNSEKITPFEVIRSLTIKIGNLSVGNFLRWKINNFLVDYFPALNAVESFFLSSYQLC